MARAKRQASVEHVRRTDIGDCEGVGRCCADALGSANSEPVLYAELIHHLGYLQAPIRA